MSSPRSRWPFSSQEPVRVSFDRVFQPRIGGAAQTFQDAAAEVLRPLVVLGAGDRRLIGHAAFASHAMPVTPRPFLTLLLVVRARHLEQSLRLLQVLQSAIALGLAERARRFAHGRFG